MGRFQKKFRVMWKILLGAVLFFGLASLIAVGYVWNKLDKINYADEIKELPAVTVSGELSYCSETVADEAEVLNMAQESGAVEADEIMNILLIGTDERTEAYNTNARADSMILVSINKDRNTVKLVSLERAVGVPILEGDLAGEYDLLTHIFRWGGADLLVKTVEHCFEVEVEHYVRLNFAAVEKIIDAVGGIDIELSAAEAGGLNDWAGGTEPRVVSGLNHLDGGMALGYARLRRIDSDWQRVGRQRKVILAVVEALKGSSLRQLNDLADSVLPLIQTNMTKFEIAGLVLYAPNFLKAEFDQMTIPKQGTYGSMSIRAGGSAFAVDYEINNDLLYRFLYEGVSSEELLQE